MIHLGEFGDCFFRSVDELAELQAAAMQGGLHRRNGEGENAGRLGQRMAEHIGERHAGTLDGREMQESHKACRCRHARVGVCLLIGELQQYLAGLGKALPRARYSPSCGRRRLPTP